MIRIVATGGTVQNTPARRIPVEDVIADLRKAYLDSEDVVLPEYDVREVIRTGSEDFTYKEWVEVARAVDEAARAPEVTGVVVTHGTFTAEETSYFLHLTVHTNVPVVVVCSQRKHGAVGNDGDHNLWSALRVAASEEAAGRGVVLVINEEIHCAREVKKVNQRPGGFWSGRLGLLGSVEKDRVSFYRSPTRRHTETSEFDVRELEELPRVDIAASYPGDDGTAVRAFVEAGARGIVIAGFTYSGEPHRLALPEIERAIAKGIPVVLTSRGNQGRVPHGEDGFVHGDTLSPQKARILLALGLSKTDDAGEMQRIFDQY